MRRSKSNSNIPRASTSRASNAASGLNVGHPGSSKKSLLSGSAIYSTPLVRRAVSAERLVFSSKKENPYHLTELNKIKKFLMDQKIITPVESNSLKPPTLALFIKITEGLLKIIDSRFQLNQKNYKEVLVKYLKLYEYPSQISQNMLKNVNSSIGWPHVLSIWSFLIDLASDTLGIESEEEEMMLLSDYIIDKYMNILGGMPNLAAKPESELKAEKSLSKLAQFLNYDENHLKELETEMINLKSEEEQIGETIKSIDEEIAELERNNENIRIELAEFKNEDKEEQLKKRLLDISEEVEIISESLKEIQDKEAQLEIEISSQKNSYNELKKLKEEYDEKQHEFLLNKQQIENYKEIRDNYNLENKSMRRKINELIREKNELFFKIKLQHPELSFDEQLPKSMISPDFKEKLEQVLQRYLDMLERVKALSGKLKENIEKKRDTLKSLKESLDDELKELSKEEKNHSVDENRILQEIDRVKFEHQILLSKDESVLQKLEAQTLELQNKKKHLEATIKSMNERKQELDQKLASDCTKGLKNIVSLRDHIYEKIQAMQGQEGEIFDGLEKSLERKITANEKLLEDGTAALEIFREINEELQVENISDPCLEEN